ncbi:MAG: polysaccharide deacetylase family protein [Candidatus Syntrophosphaera sp.]
MNIPWKTKTASLWAFRALCVLIFSLAAGSCRFLAPVDDRAPIICFTFDDQHQSVWEYALPVLQDHGFAATNFVNSGRIGNPGQLDWDQVLALENDHGWETGGHTFDHEHLIMLDYAEADSAITLDRLNLIEHGLNPRGFALPRGECPIAYYEIISRQYDYARTTMDISMQQPLNPYAIGYFPIHTGWTAEHVRARVNRGIADGEALIVIGFHCLENPESAANCPVSEFERIIRYVEDTGLEVMSLSEALFELGAID